MYDHDPEEVTLLGWEEFVLRQWESIFIGYRRPTGLRKTCRRWSDLFEAGLGCSQEVADALVRAAIVDRADRDLEGAARVGDLLAGMTEVVTELGLDLAGLDWLSADQRAGLLERHQRLHALISQLAPGTSGYQVAGD